MFIILNACYHKYALSARRLTTAVATYSVGLGAATLGIYIAVTVSLLLHGRAFVEPVLVGAAVLSTVLAAASAVSYVWPHVDAVDELARAYDVERALAERIVRVNNGIVPYAQIDAHVMNARKLAEPARVAQMTTFFVDLARPGRLPTIRTPSQ